jgi:hypothetical protein
MTSHGFNVIEDCSKRSSSRLMLEATDDRSVRISHAQVCATTSLLDWCSSRGRIDDRV